MRIRMYSIFDHKVQSYGVPFAAINDIGAQRSYARLRSDPESLVFTYPNDFSLNYLGEFDDSTGVFYPSLPPLRIQELSYDPQVSNEL